ncbi:enoyl-ACP reductase FabI [Plasticicumulans acidivorans]|uniref:Enoyl-[acyl-carrier-protein] reductase [NADH] n=1 Tax=Plasticicumulans acidivorans TaxID=886464 RepID=A0A317MVA1_9GAMM|nr:enoyl-ACP reductase FabI [Plasticicumulans acidivorans]PWV61862.1 enoyl-[acyl-carrier-protein] reductase [NADH] [Plasticicumulans acidivorans]
MSNSFSLHGKRGLVVGIANEHSIAYGIAKTIREYGGEVAATYLNEKAERFVRPLAEGLGCPLIMPCDVSKPGELESVFDKLKAAWGTIDYVVHSIAFSPLADLHGRLVDSTAEGFGVAMDISCHSFIRMAKLAEPMMPNGGTMLAMSYYGAEKVIDHYDLMGPVKAALESCVRYLAAELGPNNIRVNCISPGPILTRAASGIKDFDELLTVASSRAPLGRLATPEDVGRLAAFYIGETGNNITGNIGFVDAGYHVRG